MAGTIWTLALWAALGAGPHESVGQPGHPAIVPDGSPEILAPGRPGVGYDPSGEYAGFPGSGSPAPYSAVRSGEDMHPYDAQDPWLHGYFQEIPSYGGYRHFRPYNYKHVLSQSQVAGGWGMAPTMPYSQQFWHRYQARASMQNSALVPPPEWEPTAPRPRLNGPANEKMRGRSEARR